jgi:acyl-CoA synthetase (AMP-forming)/AMP-acid ligase II
VKRLPGNEEDTMTANTDATDAFRTARDFLLAHREDYATAYGGFRWPRPAYFNRALDWFDVIAHGNERAGHPLQTGSMGRPSPGFHVELLDPVTGAPGEEGEFALDLSARPVGLMTGYHGDPDRTAEAMAGGYYRTGDSGSRNEGGYITYVGCADDVLKTPRSGGIAFRTRIAACR